MLIPEPRSENSHKSHASGLSIVKRVGFLVLILITLLFLFAAAKESISIFVVVVLAAAALVLSSIDLALGFGLVILSLANPYALTETGTNLIISELMLMGFLSVWVFKSIVIEREYLFPKELFIPAGVLILTAGLSCLSAQYLVPAVQQVVRYIEVLIVLSFILINEFNDVRSIRTILVALLLGGLIASGIGLVQFITGEMTRGETRRVFGLQGGGYGAMMGSTLFLCLGSILYERGILLRKFALFVLPFACIALVLSQTRAWIGACIITFILMLLFTGRKAVLKSLTILMVTVTAIWLAYVTDVFGLSEGQNIAVAVQSAFRFGSGSGDHSLQDISLMLRFNAWTHGVISFLDHPWLGVGVGNFRIDDYFVFRLGKPIAGAGFIDNQYLQFFVEAGAVAGIAWIVYSILSVRRGFMALRRLTGSRYFSLAFGLFGGLLVYLVGSFFWVVTPHHEPFLLLIIHVTMLFNLSRLALKDENGINHQNSVLNARTPPGK